MLISIMKSYRTRFVALALLALISPSAQAGVIPGRWDKVSALAVEVPVLVELKSGDRIEGRFRGLTESELELVTRTAQGKIPRTEIQTITTRPKDGLGDGAAKGAAVGAIATGIFGAISYARYEGGDSSFLGPLLLVGGIAAGIGAALGVAADAANRSEGVLLYDAPAPGPQEDGTHPPAPAPQKTGPACQSPASRSAVTPTASTSQLVCPIDVLIRPRCSW